MLFSRSGLILNENETLLAFGLYFSQYKRRDKFENYNFDYIYESPLYWFMKVDHLLTALSVTPLPTLP